MWPQHDRRSTLSQNKLDEIVCDAGESVTVGNKHAAYTACKRLSQKGLQSPSAEVDATADVAVDAGGGTLSLESIDLPPEVSGLLAHRDAGVDGVLLTGCRSVADGSLVRLRTRPTEDGADVEDAVEAEAAASAGKGPTGDAAGAGPLGEGLGTDAEQASSVPGANPPVIGVSDIWSWHTAGELW